MLFISVIDEVVVTIDGDRAPLRRKEAALAAFLTLERGTPWSREQLASMLWGERDEAAARHSLRQALLALRRALGDALAESGVGLRIVPGTVQCDLLDLEERLGAGDQGPTLGPLPARVLQGFDDVGTEPFHDWVQTRRAAYRARWRDACARLRDESAASARWSDAERAARALADDLPLDIESVRQLVRALRRAGAVGEAAAALAAARTRFQLSGVDVSLLDELARALPPESTLSDRGADGRPELPRLDLVGRELQMEALSSAWRDAVSGTAGRGLLLTGIDGSGRSRLVLDFSRSIPAAQRRLLWIPGGDGPAGESAALRVARALLDARGAAAADPAVIARVRERIATGSSPAVSDIVALLQAVAAERAVLLVLDDADLWHEGDTPLRHALLAPAPRTLTLATGWSEFPSPRGTTNLELGALDTNAIAQLVSAAAGHPESACLDVASALHAGTDGHPQWILDVLESMRATSRSTSADGTSLDLLAIPSPLPLSAALHADIRRRVDALPDAARRLLDVIADAPSGATAAELARHTGLGPDALTAALEPLLRGRFASAGAHPAAAYRPAHRLIARVVRDVLHPARLLPEPPASPPVRARRWPMAVGIAAAVLVTAAAFTAVRAARARIDASGPRTIVLHELFNADSAGRAVMPVDAMLATNLARIQEVEVLPAVQLDSAVARNAQALLAEAEFDLSGAVAHRAGGVRLALRLSSRRDGRVRGGISVEAPDVFAAVDRATAEIAVLLGQPMPASPLARVSTSSLAAFEWFEAGERARATGDRAAAERALRAALRTDTTFALARLRLAQTLGDYDKDGAHAQLDTALLATARLPERERLLVRAWRAMIDEDPVRELLADSLVALWPLDANGYLIQGQARTWRGAFLPAIAPLRRAIALDAPGLSGNEASCLACDAYEGLVNAYLLADSLTAALNVAREWERRQPQGGRAAAAVSAVAQSMDDLDVAAAAARRAVTLNPSDEYAGVYEAAWAIRQGRTADALQLLERDAAHPTPYQRRQAVWFAAIAERNAGRPAAAEARLRRFLEALPASQRTAHGTLNLQRAQALLEAGEPRRAALLFDSIAATTVPVASITRMGRLRAWAGTLAADAWVAAGDTSDLARRIRDVESWGAQSAYGRDRVLHHHLRGLQALSRGDLEAARRAFIAARWSPTGTYARTNLALVDVLLRQRKPEEALQLLAQASRSGMESVHLYGTRRDLHRLYAAAYRAAGRPRDAAPHERWIAEASK